MLPRYCCAAILSPLLLGAPPAAEKNLRDAAEALTRNEIPQVISLAAKAADECQNDQACEWQARELLSSAHARMQDVDGELRALHRVRELDDALHQTEHSIAVLSRISTLRRQQGLFSQSLEELQEIQRRAWLRPQEPWHAAALETAQTGLAQTWIQLGKGSDALKAVNAVLERPDLRPTEQAQLYRLLAEAHSQLGDPYKARQDLARAQSQAEPTGDPLLQAAILLQQGELEGKHLNNLAAARTSFAHALKLTERNADPRWRAEAHLGLGEINYLEHHIDEAQQQFQMVLNEKNPAVDHAQTWRALYGAARCQIAQDETPSALHLLREAVRVIEETAPPATPPVSNIPGWRWREREVYDTILTLITSGETLNVDDVLTWVERRRARELHPLPPLKAHSEKDPSIVAALKARLQPDEVLLVYWSGADAGVVIWITPDVAGCKRIAWSERRRHLAQSWLRAVARPESDNWREGSQLLGQALLEGIPPLDQGRVQRLLIVPDATLSALPFEALTLPNGRLMIERFETWYLPSSRWMESRRERTRFRAPWSRAMVALAAPEGPSSDAGLLPGDERWADPNDSREEAEDAAMALAGHGQLFFQQSATREAFQRLPALVLHLGLRSEADLEDASRSRLLLASARRNRWDYLFLNELNRLPLLNVELVTLAQSETRVGPSQYGASVQSSANALMYAGAHAVVSTRWTSRDAVSAGLLRYFYRGLAEGDVRATALRNARLRLLRSPTQYAHPAYWAGAVLTGEGATSLPRIISWSEVAFVVSVFVLTAIVVSTLLKQQENLRASASHPPASVQE